MSNLIISAVPVTLVELLWSQCVPIFERVVKKAPKDLSLDGIKSRLLSGNSMLMTIAEGDKVIAVGTLETDEYETGHKVLYIPTIAGDRMEDWMDRFIEISHAIARDLNCVEIRGKGRKGWLRTLKKNSDEWYDVSSLVGIKVKQIEE